MFQSKRLIIYFITEFELTVLCLDGILSIYPTTGIFMLGSENKQILVYCIAVIHGNQHKMHIVSTTHAIFLER